MSGNAWEWCWDWYDTPYSGGTDPRGAALGALRVIRGGSWYDAASRCCSAFRNPYGSPGGEYGGVGFRPARHQFAIVPTVPIVATGTGPGAFSCTLTGLAPETTYYFRAYATSSIVTSYGAESSFTTAPAVPVGFALIPAGPFQMGDAFGMSEGDGPVRTVNVSAFYMGKTEVTQAEWDEVRVWGLSRGYTDLADRSEAANLPVHGLTWWDVIKWCNARSEKDGLVPVYTLNGAVMRTGTAEPTVNWTAKGFRLPTEAEWEKAARGGFSGKRFPWGDTVTHSQANYKSENKKIYDVSPTQGFHPAYYFHGPRPAPAGSFAANGYGLHDMAGNVWEWCWDWYGVYASGEQSNPTGADSGSARVIRSGSASFGPIFCRVSNRMITFQGLEDNGGVGFRVARSSVP
jgi:formylglycine-generating enzyme required for sulfatase activity